jgi:hypothetical protein
LDSSHRCEVDRRTERKADGLDVTAASMITNGCWENTKIQTGCECVIRENSKHGKE